MKIVSWNVNGVRSLHKKGQLEEIFKLSPDILCLQETKSTLSQLPPEVVDVPGYHSYFSWPVVKKGYSGVAIYSKEEPLKVEKGMGIPEFDQEGRLLVAYYSDFVLINVYFPNGGGGPERLKFKLEFYDKFLEFVENLRKKHKKIIFCGDINTAHKEIDLARPKENEHNTGFLPEERAWIDKVVGAGYIDTFRYFYPEKKDSYTYWDMKTFARMRNVGWRIDYFFASKETEKNLISIKIYDEILGSDHCPIILEVAF